MMEFNPSAANLGQQSAQGTSSRESCRYQTPPTKCTQGAYQYGDYMYYPQLCMYSPNMPIYYMDPTSTGVNLSYFYQQTASAQNMSPNSYSGYQVSLPPSGSTESSTEHRQIPMSPVTQITEYTTISNAHSGQQVSEPIVSSVKSEYSMPSPAAQTSNGDLVSSSYSLHQVATPNKSCINPRHVDSPHCTDTPKATSDCNIQDIMEQARLHPTHDSDMLDDHSDLLIPHMDNNIQSDHQEACCTPPPLSPSEAINDFQLDALDTPEPKRKDCDDTTTTVNSTKNSSSDESGYNTTSPGPSTPTTLPLTETPGQQTSTLLSSGTTEAMSVVSASELTDILGEDTIKQLTDELKSHQKPQESFIALISRAILSAREQKMVLADIYGHISENYPYFQTSNAAWQNAIRHNLSVNECFVKSGRARNGRGYFWAIHPACIEPFRKGDFRRREARRLVQHWDRTKKPNVAPTTHHHHANPSSLRPLHYHGFSTAHARPVPMTSTPVRDLQYGADLHRTHYFGGVSVVSEDHMPAGLGAWAPYSSLPNPVNMIRDSPTARDIQTLSRANQKLDDFVQQFCKTLD